MEVRIDNTNTSNVPLFTPEYSNELLTRVQTIYADDIKHYYPKLKLEKLIDLLEHTEYLFELYINFMGERNSKDALTSYIIGCFYVLLIMPQSIQFQTRNKSYAVYNEVRKLYESQINMTNVLLMVKDEVDTILDSSTQEGTDMDQRILRKRAYSVPENSLSNQIANLEVKPNSNLNPTTNIENNVHDQIHSDIEFPSEEEDQNSPLWTAPSLEPNDQLKLAAATEFLPSSLPIIDGLDELATEYSNPIPLPPLHAPPPLPSKTHDRTRRRNESVPIIESSPSLVALKEGKVRTNFDHSNNLTNNRSYVKTLGDRSITHRKNSYHSIYMIDGDGADNNEFYDESNEYIRNLERLQKQSIITAPELFSILSDSEQSANLLLIDLRLKSRFKKNHIIAPNIINIDPTLLWDQERNTPIYDIKTLEHLLNEELFNKRFSFSYIVYYSDMKTYMDQEFDYNFTLFHLLNSSTDISLQRVPTSLLGGWEKWKKILTTYSKEYDIQIADYLWKHSDVNRKHQTTNSHELLPRDRLVVKHTSWAPPEVPPRIRRRPPPPPPAAVPHQPNNLTVLPSKHLIPSVLEYKNNLHQNNKTSAYPSTFSSQNIGHTDRKVHHANERKDQESYTISKLQNLSEPSRHLYSIPTIEQNPNIYVSLSITGLRNLGNTCYINSMIQCLFASRQFRDLFISNRYSKFLVQSNDQPQLSNSFYLLFKKMYLNGGCSVVPASFLKVCNFLRPDLRIPDDQQDTQEFLMLILDRIHDELSNQEEVGKEYPNLLLYDEEKMGVQNKEYKKWFEKSVISNGFSPIDDMFQGQTENSLQCQRCGYVSYNYSTFYMLSLAIPKPSSTTFAKGKRVKLEDCINMFTSDEVLSGENAWECPHCCKIIKKYDQYMERSKKNKLMVKEQQQQQSQHIGRKLFKFSKSRGHSASRSLSPFRVLGSFKDDSRISFEEEDKMTAIKEEMKQWKTKKLLTIKRINFISMPKTLIIHLSRFYYDLTKKNNTVVSYPLILNIVIKSNQTVKYRLYGVVNHTGNLISGHYTSLVNKELHHSLNSNEQKWYYFDDEVVKEERNHGDVKNGISKISSSDAYVLFYERIN